MNVACHDHAHVHVIYAIGHSMNHTCGSARRSSSRREDPVFYSLQVSMPQTLHMVAPSALIASCWAIVLVQFPY